MNVGYAVAVAILDGAAMVHECAPSRNDADDVRALNTRIGARHDPALDGPGGMVMTVRHRDGSEEVVVVRVPRTVADPLRRPEVVEKFRRPTDRLVEPDRAAKIITAVRDLDRKRSVAPLLDLLRAPVLSPFDA